MKTRILAIVVLFFPALAIAQHYATCNPVPLLQQGFNIDHYQKCTALIRQCPKTGPIVNQSCVNQVTANNAVCNQLKSLADHLKTSVDSLSAKKIANFTIITQLFVADGQEQYFILTPNACLIDTVIDPRKLDNNIAKQYKSNSFLIMNSGVPRYQVNRDGSKTFITLLKVTKGCRACPVIGWATIHSNFTADGSLKDTTLESFKTHW